MSQDNYKVNDPKGWCGDPKRGAALGRVSLHVADYVGFLSVSRVRLNRDGYDRLGTYFGIGNPLYWVHSKDCSVDYVIRATNRSTAVRAVRQGYPAAQVKS